MRKVQKLPNDPLNALLLRSLGVVTRIAAEEAASKEAGAHFGYLKSEIEALHAVASVIEMRDQAEAKLRRRRWPLVASIALILAILSALLFIHKNTTDIELDARAAEFHFKVPSEQGLLENIPLDRLAIRDFDSIEVPMDKSPEKEVYTDSAPNSAAEFRIANPNEGTITLNSLIVPAKTEIAIDTSAMTNGCSVTLSIPRGSHLELDFPASGNIDISLRVGRKSLNTMRSFGKGRNIHISTGRNLALMLGTDATRDIFFRSQIHLESLSFVRIEEYYSGVQILPRRISSIKSGTLFFESLSSKALTLRPSENLHFEESHGTLRSLGIQRGDLRVVISDDGNLKGIATPRSIGVLFNGSVRGMTMGSAENRRSLMPTLLEWLAARQAVWVFWGGVISIAGLVVSILRWLRIES